MVSVIPENVEKIWEIWNVRGTILLSLLLQVFLVMFAPFRKRCDNIMFIFSIWSAYLLADWAANFGVGQFIPQNNNDNNNKINTNNDAAKNDVMALWAPFLMLHFGGTDTITAFALEDNQLWRRQIPSFLFQLVASLYVLVLSLPRNVLWAPTLIVFIAGIIKYTERTRALFLASTNAFREGYPCSFAHVIRLTIPNEGKNEELRVVEDAYRFMPIGAKPSENKVSTTPSNPLFITLFEATYEQAFEATKLFKKRYFMSTTTAAEALRVIELQLEFLYETFYTKAPVLHQKVGFLLRLAALGSIMIALGVFSFIHKNGSDKFDNVDVVVTYALLVGAIFIDTISLFNLIFSEWIIAHCFLESNVVKHVLYLRRQRWCQCKKPYSKYKALCTPLVFRKWGEFISGLNLIKLCLQECPPKNPTDLLCFKAMQFLRGLSSKIAYLLGAGEVIEMSMYKTKNPFLLELWQFILDELIIMTQASANRPDLKERIRSSLERAELNELSNSIQQLLHGLRFDEMLITWHVATVLCYTYDDENDDDERQFSKLLSDYMLYLLIMQPQMMSYSQETGTAGSNFRHTCGHVIKFFKEMGLSLNARNIEERVEKEACQLIPREMSTDERPYLLLTACSLAEVLKVHDKKWRAIGLVWVQILSFAADNCTTASHVTQLANGGELLSLVWILLLHLRMLH